MIPTDNGLAPGADMRAWLKHTIEGTQLTEEQVSFSELEPLIDSANATPESWQAIIDELQELRDEADAFIVLHGTDTMAYTAAALSYALDGFEKPVILTGSQLPAGCIESDAAANVAGALGAALSGHAKGVTLFFGQHLFAATRVSKSSSWAFEGFSTTHTPVARAGAPWQWFSADADEHNGRGVCAGSGWENPHPYARHDVAVIDMAPGITAARLKSMLTPLPEAIIVRGYGAGNVPSNEPGLTNVLEEAIKADVPVIIASQCGDANVLLGHYESSDALARAGAAGAGDMTLEALYAKVIFLLSQGLRGKELVGWLNKSIAGEITVEA